MVSGDVRKCVRISEITVLGTQEVNSGICGSESKSKQVLDGRPSKSRDGEGDLGCSGVSQCLYVVGIHVNSSASMTA